MQGSNRRAVLGAALLARANARKRVELCLVNSGANTRLTTSADPPVVFTAPLLCEKDAASAAGFDPLVHKALRPAFAQNSGPNCAPVLRVRVWLRIDTARHQKMKQAAANQELSCQEMLRRSIGNSLIESLPNLGPASVLGSEAAARQTSMQKRHKVAIWVGSEQRDRIHAAAAMRGQTIQDFLMAALDAQLDRIEGSKEAHSPLLEPIVDAHDASNVVVSGAIAPLGNCLKSSRSICGSVPVALAAA
jgi:hypothetical protein